MYGGEQAPVDYVEYSAYEPASASASAEEKESRYALSRSDETSLNSMLLDVIKGREPDLSQVSDEQLTKLIAYVELMQNLLKNDIGCNANKKYTRQLRAKQKYHFSH